MKCMVQFFHNHPHLIHVESGVRTFIVLDTHLAWGTFQLSVCQLFPFLALTQSSLSALSFAPISTSCASKKEDKAQSHLILVCLDQSCHRSKGFPSVCWTTCSVCDTSDHRIQAFGEPAAGR